MPMPRDDPFYDANRLYLDWQALISEVHGVTIGYTLTIRGTTVGSTPSHRDPSLPEYSIRVTAGDHEVVLTAAEWGDRLDEVKPWLREWITERVDWDTATRAKSRARGDVEWRRVLQERAPWRR